MPHSVASDLGLHCLPLSHKKDARLIWVKRETVFFSFVFVRFVLFLLKWRAGAQLDH